MPYYPWRDDLLTSDKVMDDDHHLLVARIDALIASAESGFGKHMTSYQLHNLISFTRDHFYREELQMRQVGYGDIAAHVHAHNTLLRDLTDLTLQFDSDESRVKPEMYGFLKSWFQEHTVLMDRPLALALHAQGAALDTPLPRASVSPAR